MSEKGFSCRCWRLLAAFLVAFTLLHVALPAHAQGQPGTRAQQGLAFLAANNIPASAFRDLSVAGTDPQKIAAVLAQNGYTPEQIQSFLTPENVMALNQVVNPNPAAEILGQAAGVLGKYNLTQADLGMFIGLANNPEGLAQALAQKGLSQDQITGLLGEVGPIMQQANDSGLLKYGVTLVAENAYKSLGICPDNNCGDLMVKLSTMTNDPEQMTAYLKEQGLSDEQIQAALQTTQALTAQGFSQDVVMGWQSQTALYRLEGLGVSPQELNQLVQLGDIDAIREHLTGLGLSGDELELAMVNLEGALGREGERLPAEEFEKFQADEAAALFEQAGLDPADMGEILQYKDDPEAMKEYLAEQGLDDAAIDAFVKGLDQSTFADTVDPENAEEFAGEVEATVEEQQAESEDAGTEEANTEETDTEETNTEEAGTEEAPTEEVGTEETNTEEQSTEEQNTEQQNTEEQPSTEEGSSGG